MNKIRESLGVVVRNSTAFGLRQPHLERTRLCQLSDADLDPVYVRQRSGLRDLVRRLAKPKLLNGEVRSRFASSTSRRQLKSSIPELKIKRCKTIKDVRAPEEEGLPPAQQVL